MQFLYFVSSNVSFLNFVTVKKTFKKINCALKIKKKPGKTKNNFPISFLFLGGPLFNSLFGFPNGCDNGLRPPPGAAAFGLPPHMSLFYWPYPSPPISPNSFYGMHQQPHHMVSVHSDMFFVPFFLTF